MTVTPKDKMMSLAPSKILGFSSAATQTSIPCTLLRNEKPRT